METSQTPAAEEQALSPWDRVQIARHSQRPHALEYIFGICEDFVELHGDRRFGDDQAMIGGLASLDGRAVVVLGHQKGKDTRENIKRNFGMSRPEGYRKALRLMRHAEKFGMPLLCFVDTPGAAPTKESEERGQGNAIAECIQVMTSLRVPIVATVIGEGGSGGALAISVADRILMQENAIYSVASPEAVASILWRDSAKAPEAARALKITAQDVYGLGIADEIVPEPAGGAHTDPSASITLLGARLRSHIDYLANLEISTLLEQRYAKYRAIGRYQEQASQIFPAI